MARRKFSDDLRRAIAHSEKSRYQISKESGIAQSTLSKFINGKGGLSVEGIDRICQKHLGRLIVEGPQKAK